MGKPSRFKEILIRIRDWLIINIGTRILHLWFSTCRIKIIGTQYHDRYITGPDNVIGATWHRGAIFLVWFFRKAHPMIMFSQSKDGDLLAGFAEKLGIIPIRGSSSRGGREALEGMRKFLTEPGADYRKVATVLDGPRGPRCVAKKGLLALAKMTGTPLLPIVVTASSAITLKKTWDKTLIPLPFSKVTVVYDEPWIVDANISDEDLEALRREVEDKLNEMMRQADIQSGYEEN